LSFLSGFDNKRTLNRKLSAINSFYNFCHSQEFTTSKIKIPMAKIPKNLPKYLSLDEVQGGLESIDRRKLAGKRDYALILFLYASGCRISEALSAQRADIIDGWLKIRYAKGQKERMVPLKQRVVHTKVNFCLFTHCFGQITCETNVPPIFIIIAT